MLLPCQGFTYNKFEAPSDWPRIDKTFDYKIENGKLLSGNEHIYLSGPVTYTIVGNPVIKDNVASGFSNSDYVKSANSIPSTTSKLDFNIRFSLSDISDWQTICSISATVLGRGLETNPANSLFFSYLNTNNENVPLNLCVINNNTWYDFNLHAEGTSLILKVLHGNTEIDSRTFNDCSLSDLLGYLQAGWLGSSVFKGYIDFNNTYIKVNDQLWFYGKNYTTKTMVPVPTGLEYNNTTTPSIGWVNTNTDRVKGPVNYTKIGSPTIVDGVVSGFTADDYLSLGNAEISGSDLTAYETTIQFKSNANASGSMIGRLGGMFGFYASGGTLRAIFLDIRTKDTVNQTWKYNDVQVISSLDSTKTYIATLHSDATSCYFKYSIDDGATWTTAQLDASGASPSSYFNLSLVKIGSGSWYGGFDGSIYLNGTYISANGQPWFGNCPSEFQQFIPAPEGTMIGKDDTHSLAVETYQDKGIVDYTTVGSPTIVDGVMTGDSGYIEINSTANLWSQNSFEVVYAFETADRNQIPESTLFTLYRQKLDDSGIQQGGGYYSPGNKTLYLYFGYDGNGNSNESFVVIQDNTKYKIKFAKNNSTGYMAVSTNGGDFTVLGTYDVSGTKAYSVNQIIYADTGISQLLNETYIKVNGNYWFHPYPNSYPKLVGPVNYTVVGSPTITDGIASDFSSSNYLTITDLPLTLSTYKLEIDFTTGSAFTDFKSLILGTYNSLYGSWGFLVNQNGQLIFNCYLNDGNSGTYFETYTDVTLQTNKRYYAELLFSKDDATITSRVSTDKVNWTTKTVSTGQYVQVGGDTTLGIGKGQEGVFEGSVNLSATKIYINGSLWFGKEDWKPSIYTDNSIYLLSAHTSDYSSYNELGFTPTITNNDTYNVWIDNQKVFTNMSAGTSIEWDKLDLSTGYDIITPSSLKAHIVKIEPTDKSNIITSYRCNRLASSGTENQGILQAVFNLDNEINLDCAFIGDWNVFNNLLKSLDSKGNVIKISNANYLNYYGHNLEHLPKIKINNSNNILVNLTTSSKIKYLNVDIPENSTQDCLTEDSPSLEKIDLENKIKSGDRLLSDCRSLKKLPKLNLNESVIQGNLYNFITNASSLQSTSLDFSSNNNITKLDIYGTSSNRIDGLKSLKVSNEAPFDSTTSPQINVSYTGLDRTALINLFNSLPTVANGQTISIIGCIGTSSLTNDDKAIATNKGWTLVTQ